jgi:hypothetical protein
MRGEKQVKGQPTMLEMARGDVVDWRELLFR